MRLGLVQFPTSATQNRIWDVLYEVLSWHGDICSGLGPLGTPARYCLCTRQPDRGTDGSYVRTPPPGTSLADAGALITFLRAGKYVIIQRKAICIWVRICPVLSSPRTSAARPEASINTRPNLTFTELILVCLYCSVSAFLRISRACPSASLSAVHG